MMLYLQQYHYKINLLKIKGNVNNGTILNEVVPFFLTTKFAKKTRSPPPFDLISKIQIGGRRNGL